MMYTKNVCCSTRECGKPAEYKVASPWSYGRFEELKSYGLACSEHFGDVYREAQKRRKLHAPSADEMVGEISIYRFEKGKHGKELEKMGGLTDKLQS